MRDSRIDFLRFIGLAMIIFAHVGPPSILFQLRNFDVPLMVLVSGMSFGLSYKATEPYFSYLWKRAKRLVAPVWIFISAYFLVNIFIFANSLDLNIYKAFTSYALISGIGYVWIIRVFLLVAIIAPLIYFVHVRVASNKKYIFVFLLVLLAYEAFRYFSLPYINEGAWKLVSIVSHYLIPYGVVFAIGLRVPLLKNIQVTIISLASLFLLVLCGAVIYFYTGSVEPTQSYKYPPSLYYFSYAIFVSSVLWRYSHVIENVSSKIRGVMVFCAKNSIWIYLWHIPVVTFFKANFFVEYLVAFSFSVIIVYVQVVLVDVVVGRLGSYSLRKNIRALFTG